MRTLIPIFLIIAALQVHAQFRPKIIEIDGERLPQRESMDLIFGRNSQPLIANFKTVKLNGNVMTPYVLKSDTIFLLRTEEGAGDTSTFEEKMTGNKRTMLLCDAKPIAPPAGIELKRTISLTVGQAVFLMTYDPEFQLNGQTVTLFICN